MGDQWEYQLKNKAISLMSDNQNTKKNKYLALDNVIFLL